MVDHPHGVGNGSFRCIHHYDALCTRFMSRWAQLSDDMATLRAVEMRARKENFTELAERAARPCGYGGIA